MKYRKKPVVVEAAHYDGSVQSFKDIAERFTEMKHSPFNFAEGTFVIETLEGCHIVSPNDWIIKGLKGEFYPCKADIFEATYDAVEEASA